MFCCTLLINYLINIKLEEFNQTQNPFFMRKNVWFQVKSFTFLFFIYHLFIFYYTTSLENRNQMERAACLAVLTNNFEQALDILENASKTGRHYLPS